MSTICTYNLEDSGRNLLLWNNIAGYDFPTDLLCANSRDNPLSSFEDILYAPPTLGGLGSSNRMAIPSMQDKPNFQPQRNCQ